MTLNDFLTLLSIQTLIKILSIIVFTQNHTFFHLCDFSRHPNARSVFESHDGSDPNPK